MVPVAVAGETVAVNWTVWPNVADGLLELSETVAAAFTAWVRVCDAPLKLPSPL